jgi:hypothetical protein
MTSINRREFLQMSAAASLLLANARPGTGVALPARINKLGKSVQAQGNDYTWEWSVESDQFRLLDEHGLAIISGKLQPAVIVQAAGRKDVRGCTPGKPAGYDVGNGGITVRYEGVNGLAKLSLTWRFGGDGFWLDPVAYETPTAEDVVSLHYFAEGTGDAAQPSLEGDYFVLPGIMQCSVMNPVVPIATYFNMKLDQSYWVGRDYMESRSFLQQWGLPVHYFCGFHRSPYDLQQTPSGKLAPEAEQTELLNAYCCGLAELPNGDLFLETARNRYGFFVDYRSDLWGHQRGPGRLSLGAKLLWTVGPNYFEAIRRYYLGLLKAGVIRKKTNSARKNAVALAPSFDTWGAQVARNQNPDYFDEATLNSIYDGLKSSGIKVKTFVVDGFWEGKYGDLRHSAERFPHFEETLARIRADGRYVGLWTAFMRCEDPAELGLTTAHMLHLADGKPYMVRQSAPLPSKMYYLMDYTQPEVQRVLRGLAKAFVRRYKPDFIKFDFGYELPSMGVAAPKDMNWAGEKLLLKGLEVVVNAMREENPDLVMMYYSLSPLLVDYVDLHSPDDLMISIGEYDLEANRRFFFSSLLGEIGMPTWGSSGYDWVTAPEIWFDSAAIGTLGSLGSFSGPDPKALATPERVAKFNGLTEAVRTSETFSIVPIDPDYYGPVRGAHCSSWARIEKGEVVLVALRKYRLTGGEGAKKFRGLVSSTASVVVASKSSAGIGRAAKLAVVPYGDGELSLKRERGESGFAELTEHYFGGGVSTKRLPIQNANLRIRLRELAENGSIVEWVEVTFHKE